MLLRKDGDRRAHVVGWILIALVGVIAASNVVAGNPGNMGICGACFLRDDAGALGLISGSGPKIFRPEVVGLLFGALLAAVASKKFEARSGSHAATRFVLGMWMAIGALVFLGCPFRMLQRLGGGDGNALAGLGGLIAGVLLGVRLEARGYTVGKTSPSPAPVGLIGHAVFFLLTALFLMKTLIGGPGPGDSSPPPHSPWYTALGIALAAGAMLSVTGFCAVRAVREIVLKPKAMLIGAALLIAGYCATLLILGRFKPGFDAQPASHGDHLWSAVAMALVGLSGALAGGCPVRQIIMAGEGNGDAFVTMMGILVGGALAHNLGLASSAADAKSPGGAPAAGQFAVIVGLAFCVIYGTLSARAQARSRPSS